MKEGMLKSDSISNTAFTNAELAINQRNLKSLQNALNSTPRNSILSNRIGLGRYVLDNNMRGVPSLGLSRRRLLNCCSL